MKKIKSVDCDGIEIVPDYVDNQTKNAGRIQAIAKEDMNNYENAINAIIESYKKAGEKVARIVIDTVEGVHYVDADGNRTFKPNDAEKKHNEKIVDKTIHYYCAECHGTYVEHFTEHVLSSSDKIVYSTNTQRLCDTCGSYTIEIDAELVDVIVKLNKMGVTTEFCCEGHDISDPAYIMFTANSSKIIQDYKPPYMWEYDIDTHLTQKAVDGANTSATMIVDRRDDLYNIDLWYKSGVLTVYRGMKAAVVFDEDNSRNGIYVCNGIHNTGHIEIEWSKKSSLSCDVINSLEKVITLRPQISTPEDIRKIFGHHFDMYKNIYLNSLRAWVDDLHTHLIEKSKNILEESKK